jgi:hypothetical protein
MTLQDLLQDTLGRIEENSPTDTPPGPVFWSLIGEVWPQMVDSMFEATLITGVVQAVAQSFTIAPNTTYFTNPKGMVAPLRMRAPYAIRKNSLKGLDDMFPNWQKVAPGAQIQAWWPMGVSGFGIFPQLAAEGVVTMDWITSPVNQPRPYAGTITVPFQEEFADLLSMYAAAMLRTKEGTAEAEEGAVVYQEYLSVLRDLSAFQGRLDRLVLTKAYGGKVQMNARKEV